LAKIWLPFAWLDQFFRTEDEGWVGFSIKVARGASWKAAQLLAFATDRNTEQAIIAELDKNVAFLSKRFKRRGGGYDSSCGSCDFQKKGVCERKLKPWKAFRSASGDSL
jgi:hypothetical protein